jgi:hexosaminidase
VVASANPDTTKKQLEVTLSTEFPGVEIYYTTDGSEPNNLSSVYQSPIGISKSTDVKAISFINGVPDEKSFSQTFEFNKATLNSVKYLTLNSEKYKGSGSYTLVNGIRGSGNFSDGEWQAWYGNNMNIVVDLKDTTAISSISLGSVQNIGAWIFFPRIVQFYSSMDGLSFHKIAETINDVDPLSSEIQLKNFAVTFNPALTRFIKVLAINIGKCPRGHSGEGTPAWLFVDEISVE